MVTRTLADISLKHVDMRCEDYYGRRPERDGPILVGIFIGESSIFRFIFSMAFNIDSGKCLEMKCPNFNDSRSFYVFFCLEFVFEF